MRDRTAGPVALSGVLAALMVVVLFLGSLIPSASIACPAIAGALAIPVVWELGTKKGLLLYLAVSILAFILAPNREAALFYVLFMGWYPVLRPLFQHLQKVRVPAKLLCYNAALIAESLLAIYVFALPDVVQEAAAQTPFLLAAYFLLANVCFFLYDRLLAVLTEQYVRRLRPKIFPPHHKDM